MPTSLAVLPANLRVQLLARPGLAGPPPVAVHLLELGTWTDPQHVTFTRVTMAGASFLGWGAGPAGLATVEPLSLSGYVHVDVPGRSDEAAATAMARAAVLLDELAGALRDDPAVGGALPALLPTRRWQPPLLSSAALVPWVGGPDGTAVTSVRVTWTVAWQAIN